MNIAFVGGGAIGLLGALWMRSLGHAVVVYEAGAVGGGAMSAAAGILGAEAECSEPGEQLREFLRARSMWKHFATQCAADLGFVPSGVLRFGRLEDAQSFGRIAAFQQRLGAAPQLLDAATVHERWPWTSEDLHVALWHRDDAQLEPRKLLSYLSSTLRALGVQIAEGLPVPSMHELTERFDEVVVTAGVASSTLLPEIRTVPVRGQLLEKHGAPAGKRPVLYDEHTYALSRGDGRVVVGATAEWGRTELAPHEDAARTLERIAHRLWPDLAMLPTVRSWAGLRPFLDGGPQIRRVGPKCMVATGHYRNGILLALQAGEQIAIELGALAPEPAPERAVDALQTRLSALLA